MTDTFPTEIEAQDYADDLQAKLMPLLPNNFVSVRVGRSLGGGFDITFTFAVGANRNEWQSGIIHNDPGHTWFTMYANEIYSPSQTYRVKQAGIPKLRAKKGAAEDLVKHIVTYFTKHGAALNALGGK